MVLSFGRSVFERTLRLSPLPRRNRLRIGPKAKPLCAGHILERIQTAIPDVAVEHPRHASAHLLGVCVDPRAPYAPQRAPVAVPLRPLHAGNLACAQRAERLLGAFPERLLGLRRVDLLQPDANALLLQLHDERVTINDANDLPLECLGVRGATDNQEKPDQPAQ
jgi:hypothetical protein